MKIINKKLINFTFGLMVFSFATICYSLQIYEIGDWATRNDLPKVAQAINDVLHQAGVNPTQQASLNNLKKKVIELEGAEKNLDSTQGTWNTVNERLNKIIHKGVDANGQPYEWSGHLNADGTPNPEWEKVQAELREATNNAVEKREAVKTTISALDPDLITKLNALLQ